MIWFRKKITWHLPEGRKDLLPVRATPGAMAYDLYSPVANVIPPHKSSIINTLVAVTIPKGYAIILGSRSSMAAKDSITVEGGWIDNDYRGMIRVVLYNHSDVPYQVNPGQRIAQARIVKTNDFKDVAVFTYPDVTSTQRGAGGFGSTGK
jgi:dUTP pyrophosphatase